MDELIAVDIKYLLGERYNAQNKIISKIKMNETEINLILGELKYTEDQVKLLKLFVDDLSYNFKKAKRRVCDSHAGVGKSTCLAIMSRVLLEIGYAHMVLTPTGRASEILRDKGVSLAQTIHSALYKPIIDKVSGKINGWVKDTDIKAGVSICDESSMISKELKNDLESCGMCVYYFLDSMQLPPVKAEDSGLSNCVDVRLKKVIRQNAKSPVLKVLNEVRDMKKLKYGVKEKNEIGMYVSLCKNRDKDSIDKLKFKKNIQFICGTNAFRKKLNKEIRENFGYSGILNAGEKLMVLKNNPTRGAFNGSFIIVKEIISEIYKDEYNFTCLDVIGEDTFTYTICVDGLINPDYDLQKAIAINKCFLDQDFVQPLFVDYAYAISCHKAQGGQFDNVVLYANDLVFMKYMDKENGEEMFQRSIYTGISRTIKNCIVIM